jgi:hypothetical protein
MTRGTLREAAEDLRDGANRFCAAVIGGKLDDAAYTFHALLVDQVADCRRLLPPTSLTDVIERAQTRRKPKGKRAA